MAGPSLDIKDFSLLAAAPCGEQHVDLVVNSLPRAFFARPAEVVAPELIGCLLMKRQASGELLWGVIVETEAYSQEEPACHGYRRRTPSNETLFGEPGRFYVYVSYGIHHCVKRGDLIDLKLGLIFQGWQQRSQPISKPLPQKTPRFFLPETLRATKGYKPSWLAWLCQWCSRSRGVNSSGTECRSPLP